MLISEMETLLKSLDGRVGNLDLRVGRIEQILPTLATKAELRDEIRGVKILIEDVRSDVRHLAESTDAGFTGVHQRIDAETAGLSSRMDDGFNALGRRIDGIQHQLTEVLRRLPSS
jgi:hypothetical protein